MKNTSKVLVGIAGSVGIDIAWALYPEHNQYKIAKLEGNPLAVMEHYHWGLISMIVARHTTKYQPYLDGLGAGLIVAEAGQADPFGINKPTFGASTVIGIVLSTILALSF